MRFSLCFGAISPVWGILGGIIHVSRYMGLLFMFEAFKGVVFMIWGLRECIQVWVWQLYICPLSES